MLPIKNRRFIYIFMFFILFNTVQAIETFPDTIEKALQLEIKALGLIRNKVLFKEYTDGLYHFQAGIYNFHISQTGLSINSYVGQNMSIEHRQKALTKSLIKATIAALDPKNFINYLPESDAILYHLYIFTDVTCSYSLQLHQELPLLVDSGVAVHYLSLPRSGTNSLGSVKMQAIWCHNDPIQAFQQTVNKQRFSFKLCDSPVLAQYHLGIALGLKGTPSLIFANGHISVGYSNAISIMAYLEQGLDLPETDFSDISGF